MNVLQKGEFFLGGYSKKEKGTDELRRSESYIFTDYLQYDFDSNCDFTLYTGTRSV